MSEPCWWCGSDDAELEYDDEEDTDVWLCNDCWHLRCCEICI